MPLFNPQPAGTTSSAGDLELDGTASDIQPVGAAAAAGSSGLAADAKHVHVGLKPSNNLSDVASAGTALGNLAGAPLASPVFTGTPAGPTASALTNSTQLATTAYADSAVGVEKTRALAAEALLAPLASPALTGTPTAPTQAAGDTSTKLATDAFVAAAVGPYATQVLSSPAASITFSSIPAGYSVLRLLVIGASNTAAEATRWQVRVNGDSGSHYDHQGVGGAGNNTGATSFSAAADQQMLSNSPNDLPGANATAGIAGILDVTIPAYAATTLQKTGLWRSGYTDGATAVADSGTWNGVVCWRSTAAITSISVIPVAGNLIAGTVAYLFLS